MKIEAIRHTGTYPDLYLKDRRTLVITLRTAKRDCHLCKIHIFPRTDPEKVCGTEMKCILRDRLFDYFRIEIRFSKVARYQKYYFELSDGTASWYLNSWGIYETEPSDGYFEFLYANRTGIVQVPEWSRGQVFYQIFPERFCNGDPGNDPADCAKWGSDPTRENYMGGDLRGMIKKLDHIMDLGAECIYLNPVFEADFNHKYATTDYFKVDPMFGTTEELRELIAKAHGMGIRVVLDGVFNHTGIHFKPFEDVLEHQERSEYREWFYITEYPVRISHHCYECVGAYKYMPKLNTANPEVRRFILSVMEYWIREYQIDGWRLDVADELNDAFIAGIKAAEDRVLPDALLLGEVWEDASNKLAYGEVRKYLCGTELDSAMNYPFREALLHYVCGTWPAEEMAERMASLKENYPPDAFYATLNLLGSHDRPRLFTVLGGAPDKDSMTDEQMREYRLSEGQKGLAKGRLWLAVLVQMCSPGVPCVYYGDEAGVEGYTDPYNRSTYPWGHEDPDTQAIYHNAMALRQRFPMLVNGGFEPFSAGPDVYGFWRTPAAGDDEAGERICVLVNRSLSDVHEVRLPMVAELCDVCLRGTLLP